MPGFFFPSHPGCRHIINNFAHSFVRQETGNQHIGLRPIELLVGDITARGKYLEVPPFFFIKDGCKDTGRIKMGKAKPIDGPVHSHQSHRIHITYDAVILNGLVAHARHLSGSGMTAPYSPSFYCDSPVSNDAHPLTDITMPYTTYKGYSRVHFTSVGRRASQA